MPHTRRDFLKIGGLSIAAGGFTKNLFSSTKQQTQSTLKNMVSGVEPLTAADYENDVASDPRIDDLRRDRRVLHPPDDRRRHIDPGKVVLNPTHRC